MSVGLHELGLRTSAFVNAVQAPAHAPEWAAWLADIGFLPGEPVQVLAAALPGGDPLVVRVGHSTFALRRAEAACVRVGAAGAAAAAPTDAIVAIDAPDAPDAPVVPVAADAAQAAPLPERTPA
ncbi:MAG: ferrous iron transport protein A [Rubrivivax sp.]|nr:ferrous iron transport protein A [Rubrivivax sp.]